MDHCSSPKILLLGISYPDVKGHMAQHDFDHNILENTELSVDQAVECVRRKILTEMDGRDLARCIATEKAGGGHEVYTVSKEMGGIYRSDRHVYASFNNSRGMRKAMRKSFGDIKFQQVILDYYWMPTGWLVTRWAKTLFQETLPDLVRFSMLEYPGTRSRSPRKPRMSRDGGTKNRNNIVQKQDMGLEKGVVFLPFCAHVCKELVGGIEILSQYYAITFVKKNELPCHALWKGTMSIDGNIMQHRFGKRLDQEEIYCTFNPKDIYGSMEDAHVDKDEVMRMLLSIEDFENIRMIRLRPLAQHEPPSVFKNSIVEKENGGFIGLNWEKGNERFKEWRNRSKTKPPRPQAKKTKLIKPKKSAVSTCNLASEVETEDSDCDGIESEFDTDSGWTSDSSSDEDCVEEEEEEEEGQQYFDPISEENIPLITHYFPYPALDLESYVNMKDIKSNDRVMTSWAQTWGPKSSRKKNRKQDINEHRTHKFRQKQRYFLSWNNRLLHPDDQGVRGLNWTLVDEFEEDDNYDDDDTEDDSNWIYSQLRRNVRRTNRAVRGWKKIHKGDALEMNLEAKIAILAKRDNEMIACQRLFEMKNPGFKTYSRAWLKENIMSCYQIPRRSILSKINMAAKAKGKTENVKEKQESNIAETDEASRDVVGTADGVVGTNDSSCDEESYSGSEPICEWEGDMYDEASSDIGSRQNSSDSVLIQFANLLSSAPTLPEDILAISEGSEGSTKTPTDYGFVLPPFKPKFMTTRLQYNLNPHENFPLELFTLLQDAETKGIGHIVCWQKRGRSFIVKKPEVFEAIVLRQNCPEESITFKSFITNIKRYGFCEIQVGSRKGGYRHNLFQREKPKRMNLLIKQDNIFVGDRGESQSHMTSNEGKKQLSYNDARDVIGNLHETLCKSESLGFGKSIHWEEDGKSFKVHKLNKALTKVVRDFLFLDKYSIFKKYLKDHGFKCKEGKKYAIFKHSNFKKSQPPSGAFGKIKLKLKVCEKDEGNGVKRQRTNGVCIDSIEVESIERRDRKRRKYRQPNFIRRHDVRLIIPDRVSTICTARGNKKEEKRSVTPEDDKVELDESAHVITMPTKDIAPEETPFNESVRISLLSSPSESSLLSPEKENVDLNRAETMGVITLGSEKTITDETNSIIIEGDGKTSSVSDSRRQLQLTNDSIRTKSNSLPGKKDCTKKITVRKKSSIKTCMTTMRVSSQSIESSSSHHINNNGKVQSAGFTLNGVIDDCNANETKTRRGSRKRKVCHVNTFLMDSVETNTFKTVLPRHYENCSQTPSRVQDKHSFTTITPPLSQGGSNPRNVELMERRLTSSLPHNVFQSRHLTAHEMNLFELSAESERTRKATNEMVKPGSTHQQVLGRQVQGALISSNYLLEMKASHMETKLGEIGLSMRKLQIMLSLFSSIVGEHRSDILMDMIVWRLGMPARYEGRIRVLVDLMPLKCPTPGTVAFAANSTVIATNPPRSYFHKFLYECLSLEMCWFNLSEMFGQNWCEQICNALTANFSSAYPLVQQQLALICEDVGQTFAKLLMEYEEREKKDSLSEQAKELSEEKILQKDYSRRKQQIGFQQQQQPDPPIFWNGGIPPSLLIHPDRNANAMGNTTVTTSSKNATGWLYWESAGSRTTNPEHG